MVCAMRSSENINEETLNGYSATNVKWASGTTHIVNEAVKQTREYGEENKSEICTVTRNSLTVHKKGKATCKVL